MNAVAKQRKCKVCRGLFWPFQPLQAVCSVKCAARAGRKAAELKAKQERRERRGRKEALRTVSDWTKLAQAEFNKFIRLRDKNRPCISCDRYTDAKRNAGHYLSTGSHPELRFHEWNVHAQCEHCNSYKSGNAVAYRSRLIRRIGLTAVEWLEGPHEPKRYRIEELKSIRDTYRARGKAMLAAERDVA